MSNACTQYNEMETIERVVMQRMMVSSVHAFPGNTIRNLKFEIAKTSDIDALVARLWGYFDAEPVELQQYTFTYEVPRTWWDHFKAEVMPPWFTDRYPVRYREVRSGRTLQHSCVFPKITDVDKDCKLFRRVITEVDK